MNDRVIIEGLQLEPVIGVYGWEREHRQRLLLDLELAWPNAVPGASDAVTDALDYAAVSQRLRAFAAASNFQLLEALGEALATLLQEEFAVSWLRLTLRKPGAVPEAVAVGVVLERGVHPS